MKATRTEKSLIVAALHALYLERSGRADEARKHHREGYQAGNMRVGPGWPKFLEEAEQFTAEAYAARVLLDRVEAHGVSIGKPRDTVASRKAAAHAYLEEAAAKRALQTPEERAADEAAMWKRIGGDE